MAAVHNAAQYNHPFSIQKQASQKHHQLLSKQLSSSGFDGQPKVNSKSLTHKRRIENAAADERDIADAAVSGKRLPKFVGGGSRFGLGLKRNQMAMMSSRLNPVTNQSQADSEALEKNCTSGNSGNICVAANANDVVEHEPRPRGKAALTTDQQGEDNERSMLGVHGVPFSSVRSTKTTAHVGGHEKHQDSQTLPEISQSFKNSSALNGASTSITKR